MWRDVRDVRQTKPDRRVEIPIRHGGEVHLQHRNLIKMFPGAS